MTTGYADDIVNACINTYQVRRSIETLEKFSKETGMKVNAKKSALMSNFKEKLKDKGFKFGNEEIPIVDSYKYLGVILNVKLSLDEQLNEIMNNLKKINNEYYKNSSRSISNSKNSKFNANTKTNIPIINTTMEKSNNNKNGY